MMAIIKRIFAQDRKMPQISTHSNYDLGLLKLSNFTSTFLKSKSHVEITNNKKFQCKQFSALKFLSSFYIFHTESRGSHFKKHRTRTLENVVSLWTAEKIAIAQRQNSPSTRREWDVSFQMKNQGQQIKEDKQTEPHAIQLLQKWFAARGRFSAELTKLQDHSLALVSSKTSVGTVKISRLSVQGRPRFTTCLLQACQPVYQQSMFQALYFSHTYTSRW